MAADAHNLSLWTTFYRSHIFDSSLTALGAYNVLETIGLVFYPISGVPLSRFSFSVDARKTEIEGARKLLLCAAGLVTQNVAQQHGAL